jgi:hypothetical protein
MFCTNMCVIIENETSKETVEVDKYIIDWEQINQSI